MGLYSMDIIEEGNTKILKVEIQSIFENNSFTTFLLYEQRSIIIAKLSNFLGHLNFQSWIKTTNVIYAVISDILLLVIHILSILGIF